MNKRVITIFTIIALYFQKTFACTDDSGKLDTITNILNTLLIILCIGVIIYIYNQIKSIKQENINIKMITIKLIIIFLIYVTLNTIYEFINAPMLCT